MLTAIDSLQHGLLNLRANWQLVLMQFVQTLAASMIALLGLVPIVLVLGFAFFRRVALDFDSIAPERLLERVLGAGLPLLFAFLATLLIWTLAFVVYCYFQAGLLGTLAAGERRARAAARRWQSYRTFSLRSFFELAEGLTWPVFWLLNLFALIGLLVVAGCALAAVAVVGLRGGDFGPALVVLGCFAALFLLLFFVLLSLWMQVALAELAAGARGALAASRAALVTMGRRIPAVALLFLLFIASSMLVGIVMMPVSLALEFGLRDRIGAYLAGQALVTVGQWLASGILTLGWLATLIALVTGQSEATP